MIRLIQNGRTELGWFMRGNRNHRGKAVIAVVSDTC